MLTVLGSVASSLGPREVATAWTVGPGVAEFRLVAVKSTISVAVTSALMGVVEAVSGDFVCVSAGAQAARKMANRLRYDKIRIFIVLF
jgi:hypothetical protein